jgi:CheY-like chemotaxis protein
MTLRTLVVDDEAPARRRIRRLLADEPDVTVVGECGDGASAVSAIAATRPDLVFLDVQMPERDGFDVVKALPPKGLPAILFVTAHDQYALRAFDVHAVDYLLKPFTGERFRTALARARERIASRVPDPALAGLAADLRRRPVHLSRLPVRTAGSHRLRRSRGGGLAGGGRQTTCACTCSAASTWCARRWRRSTRSSIRPASRASTDRSSSTSRASPKCARCRTATRRCSCATGLVSPSVEPGATGFPDTARSATGHGGTLRHKDQERSQRSQSHLWSSCALAFVPERAAVVRLSGSCRAATACE